MHIIVMALEGRLLAIGGPTLALPLFEWEVWGTFVGFGIVAKIYSYLKKRRRLARMQTERFVPETETKPLDK